MSLALVQCVLSGLLAAHSTALTREHLVHRFEAPAFVYSIGLSPDGKVLAAASPRVSNRKEHIMLPSVSVRALAHHRAVGSESAVN
jgi:hypothetical protein